MGKRFVHIFMIPALILLLAGCKAEPAVPTATPTEATTAPTAATTVPTEHTVPTETLPTEATNPPAEDEPTDPGIFEDADSSLPYTQRIEGADQAIYSGPGSDYKLVGTVQEKGVYTIVEESADSEGNLWGKLKSGIGWVDLTEIRSEDYENSLMSANYADENLMLHGAYHHYSSNQEFRIPVAFRAYGKLRDIALFAMDFSPEGLVPGVDLYTLAEMTEEMPLVAELDFPGDMSMYGIRFVDEAGVAHTYHISISGRNGALEFDAA